MRILNKRNRRSELVGKVGRTVDDPRAKTSAKAMLVTAAGLVGLTAASARISTLRRRSAPSGRS